MPFTFSHPAIILPLIRSNSMSATALIVGSMSPDFEYFFRMKMQSNISHSFAGIFLVDFPLGFLVMFVFHCIIKVQLIENSPLFVRQRTNPLYNLDWITYFKNHISVVLLSFFIGTCSHILWDSFTHWDGYFVKESTFLNGQFMNLPFYKLAQHLSSVIGFIILFYYFKRQPMVAVPKASSSVVYWFVVFGFTLFFLTIRFIAGLTLKEIGSVIVSVLFSLFLALSLAGLLFKKGKIEQQ